MALKTQNKKNDSKAATVDIKATAAKVGQAVEKKAVEVKTSAEEKIETAKTKVETAKAEVTEVAKVVKSEVAKKAPVKKAPVRKTAAKKEVKTTLIVEYAGRQIDEKEMIAAVKKVWTKSGNKVGEIKTIELYVKPEDSAVYFVINGSETGRADI
ncbi:MAG: DUF6465 family protein [Lachnospiraceae bacterium]